jgi:hypothetical protein
MGDVGSYQVEVSNSAGSVLSVPAEVQVTPKFGVTISLPSRVSLGLGASLVAKVQGATSAVSYQWFVGSGSISGGTGSQLLINPVLATDVGRYTVKVTDATGVVVSGTADLAISNVPEMLVGLSSQVVTVGTQVAFAVAVKYNGDKDSLVYEWYRGTQKLSDGSKFVIRGSSLVIPVVTEADFGTYKVVVKYPVQSASGSTEQSLAFESSAKLIQKAVLTTPPANGYDGPTGTVDAYNLGNFSNVWVYRVTATVLVSGTSSQREGYWILERKKVPGTDGNVAAVVAGRSAWIWNNQSNNPEHTWEAEEQQVQDASANSQAEFSVVAVKQAESFVLSGIVEKGNEAAAYGAPDYILGSYDESATTILNLEMSWFNDVDVDHLRSALDIGTVWNTAISNFKAVAPAQPEAPAGE